MRNITPARVLRSALVALSAGALTGCNLDVVDPNNASEQKVLASTDAVQATAVGLQQFYANNILGVLYINTGVTSRELTINQTFIGQVIIEDGGTAMDGSVGELATIFGNELSVMRISKQLVSETPKLPMEPGMRSGILALAHLFHAKAIGDLTSVFEQAPIESSPDENATFKPRNEALAAAVQHLNAAAKIIADTAVSTSFNTRIKGSKLDLLNTINAYRARYLLFSGSYQAAIDASNLVSPTAASYFAYDALNQNPIFVNLVQTRAYAARDGMGTPLLENGDARAAFFLSADPLVSNPKKYPVDKLSGFFTGGASPIPAYIPGEMPLIRAEAYVRLNNLAAAVQQIDAVRTKKAANDPVGLGANLAPYSGPVTADALLTEIYRQRASELYLQGLRFEDSRRLGRPGPPTTLDERNRNYYPYPDQERRNNPNTPANPAT
jgi:hypothetical protein